MTWASNSQIQRVLWMTLVMLALSPVAGHAAPFCFPEFFQSIFGKSPTRKSAPEPKVFVSQNSPLRGFYTSLNTDVFQVADVQTGLHGGHRIIVQRLGTWYDMRKDFSADGADLTPNLKMFPTAMGENAASFFGLRQMDDRHFSLPNPEELSGAIAAFNRALGPNDPRRIEIDFYPTDTAFGSSGEFIHRFALESRLPLARNGRQFYHDVAGHGLEGLLLNNEVVHLTRNRARIWLDFMKHAESLPLSPAQKLELERANARFDKLAADEIDKLGMGAGDLLTLREKYLMGQEATRHLDESGFKHSFKQAVTDSYSYQFEPGTIGGMRALDHPLLLEHPEEFYGLRVLQATSPDAPLNRVFLDFLDRQRKAHPERFKQLSFDLGRELTKAQEYAGIRDRATFEKKMRKLKLFQPFYERVDRLKSFKSR